MAQKKGIKSLLVLSSNLDPSSKNRGRDHSDLNPGSRMTTNGIKNLVLLVVMSYALNGL